VVLLQRANAERRRDSLTHALHSRSSCPHRRDKRDAIDVGSLANRLTISMRAAVLRSIDDEYDLAALDQLDCIT
jgi:hypothetical protein